MESVRAKHYDVFVSYKREDDAAREVLCAALLGAGFVPWWDAKLGQGDFRDQLRDEINRCDVVIALWSRNASANPDEVKMEMAHAFGIKKLLPLKIDDAPIPRQFAKENFLPFDGWAESDRAASQLDHILAEAGKLGARPSQNPLREVVDVIPVDVGDLPAAPSRLIGRDGEMDMLRDAWRGRAVNAMVLHAMGGAGKSALLRAFVNERLIDGGDGAARIYGWSAYSQGSGDQKRADADGFFAKALSDFGYGGPPIRDSVESGRALAGLVQRQRVLMLLDGMEPLQDPPGQMQGRFKDKGLATFVKLLGAQNPGLLILTSRQDVPELNGFGPLVIQHPLEELSDAAGADLLVDLGVKGQSRALEAAVRELQGHALSVTLLGTYLAEVCGGDIGERERIRFDEILTGVDDLDNVDRTITYARRAEKVLEAYLDRFDELAKRPPHIGGAERALLRLVGLFDRPADGRAMDMLLSKRIPGLTDELFLVPGRGRQLLSAEDRFARLREAKSRLRKLRLLADADPYDPHSIDAHPLVRAFFAGWLDKHAVKAARSAHGKLQAHYSATAPWHPETLPEMQPLFFAVQHGVKAGHAGDVLESIYWNRICRGERFYATKALGAWGALLATISNFFEVPWTVLRDDLESHDRINVLDAASTALGSLGRLRDSIPPRESTIAEIIKFDDWGSACVVAQGLCLTLHQLGDIRRAVSMARQAVSYADKADNDFRRQCSLAYLGSALESAGDFDLALECFEQAEEIAGEELYSLRGLQYCDVLLARSRAQEVLVRGQKQLADARTDTSLLFDKLELGFAWLIVGRAQSELGLSEAGKSLDTAVEELRGAGVAHFLPMALLARAAHRRSLAAAGQTCLITVVHQDLDEVAEIAGTEMRLFQADLALERARLALDVPSAFESARDEAAKHYMAAEQLVAETGYRRRDPDLAQIRARLAAMA